MALSPEVSSTTLRCNACWKPIPAGKAYKTSCNHLFCRSCAERHFGLKLVCPLCDGSVDCEGGLVELDSCASSDAAAATFSFAAFHTIDALPVIADAVAFARAQTVRRRDSRTFGWGPPRDSRAARTARAAHAH